MNAVMLYIEKLNNLGRVMLSLSIRQLHPKLSKAQFPKLFDLIAGWYRQAHRPRLKEYRPVCQIPFDGMHAICSRRGNQQAGSKR
ncbi:MAG: hypothetical protein Q8S00_25580 [Deltaproteobacteria bacterium]|nr:hypothetical protein [Deltaproteobacteria bacterium]